MPGLTKINVGTLLNVAFTDAVRSALAADEAAIDPRRYLAAARDAVADAVHRLLTQLADDRAAAATLPG